MKAMDVQVIAILSLGFGIGLSFYSPWAYVLYFITFICLVEGLGRIVNEKKKDASLEKDGGKKNG